MGTDSVMGAKGRFNASEAIDHLRKHFKCEAKGSLYGNKLGNLVANSVKAILDNVNKLHDPKKKGLESLYIRFVIHDSDTVIDYNNVLPIINKITTGLREKLPKTCSVNYMNGGHSQDHEIKMSFECFIVEKELWQ